jgi:hypothetical protein
MVFVEIQLVETQKDLDRYCNIWLPVWIKDGYELESYITRGIERYIFLSETNGEEIGCCEFNPYYIDSSSVNEAFPFNKYLELRNKKVIELEKLVIKDKYQGSVKRLIEIFNFLALYSFQTKCDYIIALLNPHLYIALTDRFKIPFARLSDEKFNNNEKYIPALLEIKAFERCNFGQKVLKKHLQSV